MEKCEWINGEYVKAMAYDTPVPGYNTFNTNCLRLWSALPSFDKNYQSQCKSSDEFVNLVEARQRAERITSVLYPKEERNLEDVQELIIKQQYFFCAATIKDIIRRYKKNNGNNFEIFASKIAIQLNDAHPAIGIIELLRVLIDEEGLNLH